MLFDWSGCWFSEAFLRPINHRASARFWNNESIFKSLCLRALSLRGTNRSFANQSMGMMKGCLKAFARKLTDWFNETPILYARNNKAERIVKAKFAYKTGQLGFVGI
jgi:hypothetical protein